MKIEKSKKYLNLFESQIKVQLVGFRFIMKQKGKSRFIRVISIIKSYYYWRSNFG